MRDIKFRAWSTLNKKMIKQEKQGDWFTPRVDTSKHKDQSLSLASVFNEKTLIVEQYTGLKDKNGIEIYEGDIFKAEILKRHPTDRHGGTYWVKALFSVEQHNGKYVGRAIKYIPSMYEPDFNNINLIGSLIEIASCKEVIGNIHQNPELVGDA